MDTIDYVWLFIFIGIFALAIIIPCIWCMCYKCRTRGPITPLPVDYPRQVPIGGVVASSSLSQQEAMPMMGTHSE